MLPWRKKKSSDKFVLELQELKALFEASLDGIIVVNNLMEIIGANKAALDIFEMTEEELIGTSGKKFFDDGSLPLLMKTWTQLLNTGEIRDQLTINLDNSKQKTIDFTAKANFMSNKHLVIMRDVTQKIISLDKINMQSKLLEAVNQAIIVTDLKGNITYWNKYAEKLYGWSEKEVLGRNVIEVTPSDMSQEQAKFVFESLQKGGTWQGEFEVRKKDGSSFTAFVIDAPINNESGELTGIIGISRDVTHEKQIEKQLIVSEKKYRTLYETMFEGVIYLDENGNIVSANPSAAEILGLSQNQLLGKTLMDKQLQCIYEDGNPLPVESHPASIALKTGKEVKNVVMGVYLPQNGNYRWILVNAVPLFEENKVKNVYATFEDITSRKLIEEELSKDKARDEAIIASLGLGLIVTDKEGRVTIVNKAFSELLGWAESEVIGKDISTALIKEDESGARIPVKELLINKVLHGEQIEADLTKPYYFIRKDGSRIPVFSIITPIIFEGKILGAVETFRDISREKEIDRAKTEFVSLASHQLRTPLSTINWYIETLLTQTLGSTTEKQKEYLEQVYKSSQRMVDLVNALLNVSRIELGTFLIDPKPTSFQSVADEVLVELDHLIKEREITFKKNYDETLPEVVVDPKLLRVIFQNLLTNSIKYTPPKGTVTFEIKLDKSDILIKVADTGCGIPKAQQSLIFTKLFRADNVRELETDGTGLGLYIAKAIIDQSGGKIWFESEENKGTTFYATLPITGMKPKEGYKVLN